MTTTPPALTTPPAYPDPNDRPGFAAKAFSWAKFLNDTFHPELIALAQYFYNNADAATQSALDAAGAALIAQQSAASAVNAPGTSATSTTSLTVSTGIKTLSIQTGKQFVIGQPLMIASASNPMLHMYGIITAHNSGTGSLTVNVTGTSGEGTAADWSVGLGVAVVSTLPAQAGHAGQFLKTDGSAVSWVDAVTPSGAQTLSNKTLASPAITGTPTAPTQAAGDNSTKLATTAFVADAISSKANLASPTFTGTPAAPTAAIGTNTTQIATTAFVSAAISSKANLASPTFTGTPAAPTAAIGTNTTQIATTAFVSAAIASLVNSSPAALDTLNEFAAALGNDPNFATTITNALAAKAPLASPALTGTPTAPTPATDDESTRIATTAQVAARVAAGRLKFTAAGAITKGAVVVLNDNGTVSPVTYTLDAGTMGSEQVQFAASVTFQSAMEIPGTNKMLFSYNDGAQKVVVGELDPSTSSITFGTPVSADWATTAAGFCWHPTESRVVGAYVSSSVIYLVAGTITGLNITFGTPSSGGAAIACNVAVGYNAHQNKLAVVYCTTVATQTIKVCHLASDVFTWGTTATLSSTAVTTYNQAHAICDIPGSPEMVVSYGISGASTGARVATISGQSVSLAAEATTSRGYGTGQFCQVRDPVSGKVILFVISNANTAYFIITKTGKTLAFGLEQNNAVSYSDAVAFDASNGKFIIFGRERAGSTNYAIAVPFVLSGSSLVQDGSAYINSAPSYGLAACYVSNCQKLAFAYQDLGNLNYGTTRVWDSGDQVTTANKWLGIAAEAIADGAAGRVFGKGEICDALAGLNINATYYIDDTGAIQQTGTRVLGRAVAANKLLITG